MSERKSSLHINPAKYLGMQRGKELAQLQSEISVLEKQKQKLTEEINLLSQQHKTLKSEKNNTTSLRKSSIRFRPVQPSFIRHTERTGNIDLVFTELSKTNESWKIDEITNRHQEISDLTKKKTGRKMQAKTTPIREAIVNLTASHTMENVKNVTNQLTVKFGISPFQIYIHRDEGKTLEELNYHAHLVFDWQDKETGKTFKLNRKDMREIQDIVANELDMIRGNRKE
jgi:hypothetical protein